MKKSIGVHSIVITLALLFGISLNICAQELPALNFKKFSTDDGLSGNQSLFTFQDNEGFIWIGSNTGTDKYDGYNFNKIISDKDDPNSVSTDVLSSIAQDSNKNLWLSSNNSGLEFYDFKTEQFKNIAKDIDYPQIKSLREVLIDTQQRIWIISKDLEVSFANLDDYYTNSKLDFKPLVEPDNNQQIQAYFISSDKIGNIWLATKEAIYVATLKTNNSYSLEKLNYSSTTNFYKDKNNDLWFFGNNQLYKIYFDNSDNYIIQTFKAQITNKRNQYNTRATSLAIDHNMGVWLGSSGNGLYTAAIDFNNQTFRINSLSEYDLYNFYGISSNIIRHLMVDKNNNIWISLVGGGVNKYDADAKQFGHAKIGNKPGQLPFKSVRKIIVDKKDNLWVGEQGSGLAVQLHKDDDGSYSNFIDKSDKDVFKGKVPPGPNYAIGNVGTDTYNSLYFFTWGKKVIYLDPEQKSNDKFKFIQDNKETLSAGICIQIYTDLNNDLWYAHFNGGLTHVKLNTRGHIESSSIYKYNPKDSTSLPNNTTRDVIQTQDGTLWVGTAKGLARVLKYNRDDSDLKFESFYTNENDTNSISNDYVICFAEGKDGTLWIGTYGGGLNKFIPGSNGKKDSFKAYTEKEGLSNNIVKNIVEDDNGDLWISTGYGLSKFNPKTEQFRNYTKADGLQDNDFFDLCGIKRKNGQILIGGVNGFNYFFPDSIKDNPYKPNAKIVNFKINNKNAVIGEKYHQNIILPKAIQLLDEITISYKERIIEFELTSDHYSNPEKNKFQYKLEPFDEEWITTNAQRRFITYNDLSGGEYTFRYKAANGDGLWGEEKTLTITVIPPFWKTAWFIILSITLIVAAFIYITRRRTQKLKEDQKILKQKIEQATADVKIRNERLEEAKQKIASIMDDVKSELGKASEELLEATNSQASTIEEISSSIEQMTSNIKEDALNAEKMHKQSLGVEKDVDTSVSIVAETATSMENITKEISFISEFARTTNLLSLNATIEAAKAGVHGRSFSVVANEIKKLADQSQEIASKIKKASESGLQQSKEANMKIHELQNIIRNIIGFITQIKESSLQQSYETNNINTAIQQISSYINSTNLLAEKLDQAINALSVEE